MANHNQIEIIEGTNLFDADTKYIVHQCNCVTSTAAHLAKDMFEKFPYSNVYENRIKDDEPGTIKIMGDGLEQRYVISMFGQYYPGKSKYPNSPKDGFGQRELYFALCLNQIRKIENLESIGFPYKIGCGAAGGNWNIYFNLLKMFANKVDAKVKI